jgi:hypothetical protein
LTPPSVPSEGAHALHSAARRYCMTRLDALADIHGSGRPPSMNPAQLDAWLGEIALRGILPSIEAALPDQFSSTERLRAHLLDVCAYARLPAGDVRDDPDSEPAAQTSERNRFRTHVAGLTEAEAERLERVPARRVLDATERREWLQRIAQAWPSAEERWHPHAAVLGSPGVAAIQIAWVGTDELPLVPMRRALADLAGARISELHEGSPWWSDDVRAYAGARAADPARIGPLWLPGYELDPALWWTPTWSSESLWASSRLDWLLYAHHEGALYAAGAALVGRLVEIWPAWERRVWKWGADEAPHLPPPRKHLG